MMMTRMILTAALLLAGALLSGAQGAQAQTTASEERTSIEMPATAPSSSYNTTVYEPRRSALTPTPAPKLAAPAAAAPNPFEKRIQGQINSFIAAQEQSPFPLFGYQLFSGRYSSSYADTRNPDYIVSPGDVVTVSLWGSISRVMDFEVDAQGVIFVPEVGPVRVGGVRSEDLNREVQRQISRTYNQSVNVYTNLQGASPVNIFVMGAVVAPGRYEGGSSDSLLYYIDRAGGIDPDRGSLRHVSVVRGGEAIQTVDLYDFFLNGVMPKLHLREGDTLVVQPRGGIVRAGGSVVNTNSFEIADGLYSGADMIGLVRPLAETTHVQVQTNRDGAIVNRYMTLAEFRAHVVRAGDTYDFVADMTRNQRVVSVVGPHSGPMRFVVPEGTRLVDVLRQVPVTGKPAALDAVYIKRKSVADAQKIALVQSVERLERSLISGDAVSPEQAQMQRQEAELVRGFIDRVKEAQPEGRVALSDGRETARQIMLEDGDVIVIPEKTDLVFISGEVFAPQAIVHKDGAPAGYYLQAAGGVSERGDKGRIVVRAHNGAFFNGSPKDIKPGDEIIVLPRQTSRNLELAKAVADITYKLVMSTVMPIGVILNNN